MKIAISFTIELTPEQEKACLHAAEESGFNFNGDMPKRELLKRYFRDNGESGILRAMENYNLNN